MERTAIVLVHGYSGSPDLLLPLTTVCESVFTKTAVRSVCLPGHDGNQVPAFDKRVFTDAVIDALQEFKKQNRKIVLIGHSTGGVIALSAVFQSRIVPEALVLASVPRKIDTAYLDRWARHRSGKWEISFPSVANMVKAINEAGSARYEGKFPVLVLNGADDELVPASDAALWLKDSFNNAVRKVIIPGAGHDLFRSDKGSIAVQIIMSFITDAILGLSSKEDQIIKAIDSVEPEAERFIAHSPLSARHLAASPSGRTAADQTPVLTEKAPNDPIIANIEITTRCNLRCAYCARSIRGAKGDDMSLDRFKIILGLLPNTYRITLVGLGETLLHPDVARFVSEAASQGRRVALVTNAMLLDDTMGEELLDSGLESIAFSLDAPTQAIASEVRPGTDLDRVVGNIKRFVARSRSTREISTAVFAAVSTRTVNVLDKLIDMVSGLGVHVMMLTDLNFRENVSQTLWKNIDDKTAGLVRTAVSTAFKKQLPVLSVRGLEEFGLWKRYGKYLLLPPDQLYQRSPRHAWCFSPWQTIVVNVHGDVTLCDCQPEIKTGNLLVQPLSEIWNGEAFANHRKRMMDNCHPEACSICPRF